MQTEDRNISLIWKSFLKGDKEAFAGIYNLFVNDLYNYGTKLSPDQALVKDAIQEVFLDLFLKREKNKTNPSNLKYYLLLALKRNLVKKLKRQRKLLGQNGETDDFFEPVYCIEQEIIKEEEENTRNRKVTEALNSLPPKQKEAIYLRFQESMEYPEIAAIVGISVESVRKQVYRGLKTVRDSFLKQPIIMLLISSKNHQ